MKQLAVFCGAVCGGPSCDFGWPLGIFLIRRPGLPAPGISGLRGHTGYFLRRRPQHFFWPDFFFLRKTSGGNGGTRRPLFPLGFCIYLCFRRFRRRMRFPILSVPMSFPARLLGTEAADENGYVLIRRPTISSRTSTAQKAMRSGFLWDVSLMRKPTGFSGRKMTGFL